MKITGILLVVVSHFSILQSGLFIFKNDHVNLNGIDSTINKIERFIVKEEVRAVSDTFFITTDCNTRLLIGNVLINDVFNPDSAEICYVFAPGTGLLTFCANGSFTLSFPDRFMGTTEFKYGICDKNDKDNLSEAMVVVFVENDNDCDGVSDNIDMDNDNDGILNTDEYNGLLDSDEDEIPDSFDIDSDNDGITDNVEWQQEDNYIKPSESDSNRNGWDDIYDVYLNGSYYKPVDTDNNGIPDYLDLDSDNDGFLDKTEGFDEDGDGFAEINPLKSDTDKDGLDDAFDVVSSWKLSCNSTGSSSPLPDLNSNGIRDWRDSQNESNPDEKSNIQTQIDSDIFIYPNPSNGDFSVSCTPHSEEELIRLEIFNLKGTLIYTTYLYSGLNKVYINKIESGFYLIKIKSNSLNYFSRLTIQ